MKTNLTLCTLAITVVLIVLLGSCRKDHPVPDIENSVFEGPTLSTSSIVSMKKSKEPFLIFENSRHLYKTMDQLVNKEDEFLDAWESSMNFQSMRTYFDNLSENTDTDFEDSKNLQPVQDPFFATVLNPQGIVQVADTVWRITKDNVYYEFPGGSSSGSLDRGGVKCHKNYVSTCATSYSNGKKQFRGTIWNVNWWIYKSVGIKTNNFKGKKNKKGKTIWSKSRSTLICWKVDYLIFWWEGNPLNRITIVNKTDCRPLARKNSRVFSWFVTFDPDLFTRGFCVPEFRARHWVFKQSPCKTSIK